ncbi:MAG: hypothetical protein HYV63_12985 [Candidatus Schekmanbacteria bacterium]|nr:hypothetical protein [Candidatus Schekmanbacteria bacterium]
MEVLVAAAIPLLHLHLVRKAELVEDLAHLRREARGKVGADRRREVHARLELGATAAELGRSFVPSRFQISGGTFPKARTVRIVGPVGGSGPGGVGGSGP